MLCESPSHSEAGKGLAVVSPTQENPGNFSNSAKSKLEVKLEASMSLKAMIESASGDLLFRLYTRLTRQSLEKVCNFHIAFCTLSPDFGISSKSAGAIWESIIQSIFDKLRHGHAALNTLTERTASAAKETSVEALKNFATDYLGLNLTMQEFELFIVSLGTPRNKAGSNGTSNRHTTLTETFAKSLKTLSSMFEEIYGYGLFQQVLYIISSCLAPDPVARPSYLELRKLGLFGLDEELSHLKAAREARALLSPFNTPEDFFEDCIYAPVKKSVLGLVLGPATPSSHPAALNQSTTDSIFDLQGFSNALNRIEELIALLESISTQNEDTETFHVHFQGHFHFLASTGVDPGWLLRNAPQICNLVAAHGAIQAIALFVIRFSKREESQLVSGYEYLITDKATQGLGIGLRLLMRVQRLLQNIMKSIDAVAKSLKLDSHVSTEMTKKLVADSFNQNQQHSTTATAGELEHPFSLLLSVRAVVEQIFGTLLSATAMLYLGEECPHPKVGARVTSLADGHPSIFTPYSLSGVVDQALSDQLSSKSFSSEFIAESRWSVQMSKVSRSITSLRLTSNVC